MPIPTVPMPPARFREAPSARHASPGARPEWRAPRAGRLVPLVFPWAAAMVTALAAGCKSRTFAGESQAASARAPAAPAKVNGVVRVTDWAAALGAELNRNPKVTVLGLGGATLVNAEIDEARFAAWEGLRASQGVRTMFLEGCLTGSWRIHTRKSEPKVDAVALADELGGSPFVTAPFLDFLDRARVDEDFRLRSAPLLVGVDPRQVFRCDPLSLHAILDGHGAGAKNAVDLILAFAKRYADPNATLARLESGATLIETLESDFAAYDAAVETLDSLTGAAGRDDVAAAIAPPAGGPGAPAAGGPGKGKPKSKPVPGAKPGEDPASVTSPYADLDENEVARAFARVAVVQLRSRLSSFSPFTEEFRLLRRQGMSEERKAAFDALLEKVSDRLRGPLDEAASDEGMALSIVAWQETLGPARGKGILWARAEHVARGTMGASGPGTPLGFLRAGGQLQKLTGDAYLGIALDGAAGHFETLRAPDDSGFGSFRELKTRAQVEGYLAEHKETCELLPRALSTPLRSALEGALGDGAKAALFMNATDVVASRTEYELLSLGMPQGSCDRVLGKALYARFRMGDQFDGVALFPKFSPVKSPLTPRALERIRASIEATRKSPAK